MIDNFMAPFKKRKRSPNSDSNSNSNISSSDISSLPIFKLTITLCLKVNQVFISDYNNLNSAASLSFIQNFTKFVNYQLLIVYFINFYYFLIQKDEYCFKK